MLRRAQCNIITKLPSAGRKEFIVTVDEEWCRLIWPSQKSDKIKYSPWRALRYRSVGLSGEWYCLSVHLWRHQFVGRWGRGGGFFWLPVCKTRWIEYCVYFQREWGNVKPPLLSLFYFMFVVGYSVIFFFTRGGSYREFWWQQLMTLPHFTCSYESHLYGSPGLGLHPRQGAVSVREIRKFSEKL